MTMKGQGAIGTPAPHQIDPNVVRSVIDLVDDELEIIKLAKSTTGTGDVRADLDQMVGFYNNLAELRGMLREYSDAMSDSAIALHALLAGGAVPGVRDAWMAIGESIGIVPGGASLHGNVQALDQLIGSHMAALAHNVAQYAAQDNRVVTALSKVATSA